MSQQTFPYQTQFKCNSKHISHIQMSYISLLLIMCVDHCSHNKTLRRQDHRINNKATSPYWNHIIKVFEFTATENLIAKLSIVTLISIIRPLLTPCTMISWSMQKRYIYIGSETSSNKQAQDTNIKFLLATTVLNLKSRKLKHF